MMNQIQIKETLRATAKVTGYALLLITVALALFAALEPNGQRLVVHAAGLAAPNTQTVDYDADNDGLIEISNLEQLNALRWDVDGNGISWISGHAAAFPTPAAQNGCPRSCSGYELVADLDFNDPGSFASGAVNTAWTSGAGWAPIGTWTARWSAALDGNGHTISNLFIKRSGNDRIGLFGVVSQRGALKRLGLVNARVSGNQYTGALVGDNQGGRITATFATVTVNGHRNFGGLVGYSTGAISTSYVTGSVTTVGSPPYSGNAAVRFDVGGLVGTNHGGTVQASYSTASAVHHGDIWYYRLSGLIGGNIGGGTVRNSYSTGSVSEQVTYGDGLISSNETWSGSKILNSYYDSETSGRSGGTGAKTTAELQSPTSASGIYAQWNPQTWDFGTARDYPLLSVDFNGDGTASWQEFGEQTRAAPLPATVESVWLSSKPGVDKTYDIGDVIEAAVIFTEDVTVTGAPQLALDFDGSARTASHHSAAGTEVFFTYTVVEGDVADNGVAISANALTLNGGAIAGPSGEAADLAHEAVAADSSHRVDGVRPTISSGSVSEDGTKVSVVLSEPVQTSPLLQWFIDEHKLPAAFQFIVSVMNIEVDGTWPVQTNAVIEGDTVTFTMKEAIASGQKVQARYDGVFAKFRPEVMMDVNGNHLTLFGPTEITNSSTVTAAEGASGITLSVPELEIQEGQSASYSVRLSEEPAGPVMVKLGAHYPDNVTISATELEFDSETWNTAQTVTVSSVTDDDNLGYWVRIRHTAGGSGYTGNDAIRILMRE